MPRPHVLQAERDLVQDAGEDDLVLGVLEERCNGSCQAGRAVASGVEPGDLDAAGETTAVKMGYEPRERTE